MRQEQNSHCWGCKGYISISSELSQDLSQVGQESSDYFSEHTQLAFNQWETKREIKGKAC